VTQNTKNLLAMQTLIRAQDNTHIFLSFLNTIDEDSYKGRTGAYQCVRDNNSGVILALGILGSPPVDRMKDYCEHSQEKGGRLYLHPEHWTSHESKNEEKKQYPGAIRGKNIILSVSGFPPKADSLHSVWNLEEMGELKDEKIDIRAILEKADIVEIAEKFKKYMHDVHHSFVLFNV
jgi:hypothetical protein